ncbi:MAG: 16S rRNA (guanine(966)-N(2))-methyltransferase RsmD [Cyanobium sp. M30B3]|nr:MAG: 16S rRNA (guanine(966)-N(2))-methyltransferase RsmD [Cyanobium sp. M30B3]
MSLRLSGGRRLQSPSGATARPTPSRVRLALMNILAAELPGSRWLDLCSGSGVMACEALQRGAAAVVAVEQDRRHVAVARANLEAVRAGLASQPSVRVDCAEVGSWLRRPLSPDARGAEPSVAPGQPAFHLIYADPPYASALYPAICAGVAAGHWLRADGTLMLECASSAVPALVELPGHWTLRDQRRYGSTTVILLQPSSREPRRY